MILFDFIKTELNFEQLTMYFFKFQQITLYYCPLLLYHNWLNQKSSEVLNSNTLIESNYCKGVSSIFQHTNKINNLILFGVSSTIMKNPYHDYRSSYTFKIFACIYIYMHVLCVAIHHRASVLTHVVMAIIRRCMGCANRIEVSDVGCSVHQPTGICVCSVCAVCVW